MKNTNPPNIRFTFRKEERLCSQKIIAGLFEPGFFVTKNPIRINTCFVELPVKSVSAQVMFVVGKKRFKSAVVRNRIRRMLKEMYRLEKHRLYGALLKANRTLALAVIFTGQEMKDYQSIKTSFGKALDAVIHEIHRK